jgi:cobalt-zinc-cadmium efflux system membrane fusion protein
MAMTGDRGPLASPLALAAIVAAAVAAGAGATYVLVRGGSTQVRHDTPAGAASAPAASRPAGGPAAASATPTAVDALPDLEVTLEDDAVERAGIVITRVGSTTMSDVLRLPGVVEPNAYRLVSVTPLVGGRVVGVLVQLGDRVKRGQAIAQVYSPELAGARTKFVAARAMLDAHDRELQRTQKLVEIGAASRQELERAHAEHAAQTAEVESARSRLALLGVDAETAPSSKPDAAATTTVPAPIDGVVTERLANVGLNVDPASKLFTIVDLSTVWIIADVYERDLQGVRVGNDATVTTAAYPNMPLTGRVSYIDPQLSSDTRTAKVRIEVANPRGDLRLGMFTDVSLSARSRSVLSVPASAVQNVGGHQVVYIPAPKAAAFIEREVHIGHAVGNTLEIISGLRGGDSVVSEGSFFVRAEAERLGLRVLASPARASAPPAASTTSPAGGTQTARVLVNEKGYEPARVTLRAGVPARLTFVRTTDKTCGTDIVFPSLDIKRPLPLDEPVAIEFTPAEAGEIAFVCGMNMLKGVVIVQ